MINKLYFLTLFSALILSPNAFSNEEVKQLTAEEIEFKQSVDECMSVLLETGIVSAKKRVLQRYCETKIISKGRSIGRLGKRIMAERATELNPFVITPHEMSYIMPIVITDNFNTAPYEIYDLNLAQENGESKGVADGMLHYEAKYQISFKVPLRSSSLFINGDAIYFAMTIQAWWQLYSDDISKPFRETNYKPEIFYIAPLPWQIAGGNLGFAVNLEHQSNGQLQGLSRSWNRAHMSVIYDTEKWSTMIKVWHRFKEDKKDNFLSPTGDDNPDIEDFYGNYEFKIGYAINDNHKLYTNIRKNWQTGNGSIEINYSFPFTGRLRGFAQYFSGYGESLIDYNHKQQKLGIGIALTEIF